MAYRRKSFKKAKSMRTFKRTAKRIHPLNMPGRGGFRL